MMVADFVNDFVYDRCVADSLIEFLHFFVLGSLSVGYGAFLSRKVWSLFCVPLIPQLLVYWKC